MDAGPWLPQCIKCEEQGSAYWYGRGIREPADNELSAIAYVEHTLPTVDASRETVSMETFMEVAEEGGALIPSPEHGPVYAPAAAASSSSFDQWLSPAGVKKEEEKQEEQQGPLLAIKNEAETPAVDADQWVGARPAQPMVQQEPKQPSSPPPEHLQRAAAKAQQQKGKGKGKAGGGQGKRQRELAAARQGWWDWKQQGWSWNWS